MLDKIQKLVELGKHKQIEEAIQDALDNGEAAGAILGAMTAAMDNVGEKFQRNELYVPEILVAAKTMQRGVNILKPSLGSDGIGKYGKFIIGTVAGDLHDIGKNLVAMMVESAGFEVIDLGVDVPTSKFLEAIKANPECKVIGLSALLTTTMDAMADTCKAIHAHNPMIQIMVGGAPITQSFADQIGAQGYSSDAASAATLAKKLVG